MGSGNITCVTSSGTGLTGTTTTAIGGLGSPGLFVGQAGDRRDKRVLKSNIGTTAIVDTFNVNYVDSTTSTSYTMADAYDFST